MTSLVWSFGERNGKISLAEFLSHIEETFTVLDQDEYHNLMIEAGMTQGEGYVVVRKDGGHSVDLG